MDVWSQLPESASFSSGIEPNEPEQNSEYGANSSTRRSGLSNGDALQNLESRIANDFEYRGRWLPEPDGLTAFWQLSLPEAEELEALGLCNESTDPSTQSTQSFEHLAAEESSTPEVLFSYATNELADTQMRGWLRHGLLKIYHDSMEGALGCWLISRNCPYQIVELETSDAWGMSWSNRIAKAVCALDQHCYDTGMLSEHHHRQGTRTLNLVIMAFAAQWAQSGPRTTASFPDSARPSHPSPSDPFGGDLQQRLWEEASQALCLANHNTSFKAIFAGIVFSLTQAPLGTTQRASPQAMGISDELDACLEQDEASIYLDIALRKLHDHQRRLQDQLKHQLPPKHQRSFRLLLWLAVMFDTLAATMNKRSFVVNDYDSSVNSDQIMTAATALPNNILSDLDGLALPQEDKTEPAHGARNIWGDYFMRDTQYRRCATVRWPCTYTEAATCLADAAPVKVLLFRRVGHVQDLLYQQASPTTVSNAISAVLEVYHHWNNSYGLFINDCASHHELLPARIQSWYILLAGHWHLAVLLFCDLLDKTDCGDRALCDQLRNDAVDMVAQLGRVSTQSGLVDTTTNSSFSQSSQFHHAVNHAALLTEPWTIVLVRVFGLAAKHLIRRIQLLVQQRSNDDYGEDEWSHGWFRSPPTVHGELSPNSRLDVGDEERRKLKWCLEALWLLGRKSDVAVRVVSLLLSLEAESMPSPDHT